MRRLALCLVLVCFVPLCALLAMEKPSKISPGRRIEIAVPAGQESFQSLDDMLSYISGDWTNLSRSLTSCDTFNDPKISGDRVLYLPAEAPIPAELADLQKRCAVRLEHLPEKITAADESKISGIRPPGLLYLENPYVVPGGQFNEMYGWDSYFIIRGLLRDGRRDMARGIVENFFYEIQHYGGVLNANRTYYLGRSQPPFLSSMILAVYEADKAAGSANLDWLRRAYTFAVSDYELWIRPPHLAGDTLLSRYFDAGDGPVPEIMRDPSHYYREVMHYFLIHEGEDSRYLVRIDAQHPLSSVVGPVFDVSVCDSPDVTPAAGDANCAPADLVALTRDFYTGDRSMRESGFDVTFRFGPFGAETHHYAPVGLNSLLYKTEKDLEQMSVILGDKDAANRWEEKAAERRERMDKYFWDPVRGMFFDYDFMTRKRSTYDYATTFYPLWAGLATKAQARAVAGHLNLFEQPGGLAMSRNDSEAQWDYPYGWAPIQLLAVEGLRRYGYAADADGITRKFVSMVLDNFRRDHTLREKYNVVTRSAETQIEMGYTKNMTGFGWTNGVVLELLHEAPPELAAELRED